jgi:hypothetical protein
METTHKLENLTSQKDIMKIVKMQALIRGFIVRRRFMHLREGDAGGINRPSFSQEPNYDNQEVQQIREQLGDFDYGTS